METKKTRFAGLQLSEGDRRTLAKLKSRGRRLTAREWRRIRVLEVLDEGLSIRETAKVVGGYPREAGRVGKRYVARGLDAALTDEPRAKPPRKLDSTQQAALVAMVCGPPPDGRARWTVRLAAEYAQRRGIIASVGREKIRLTLATHGLKPWREKNVVRPGNRPGIHRQDGEGPRNIRPTS